MREIDELELSVQKSFNRLGVELAGRTVEIVGGVHRGYGVNRLSEKFFEQNAEAVLVERDPSNKEKCMVSAVFRSKLTA